jgi:hypothetical protein
MRIDLHPNELVLKAADTKHYVKESKLEGKLILTNQRLYFATVNGTANQMRLEIEPKEIKEVMNFSNRFLFSNGLRLLMNNGEELRFEINKRNDWAGMIARVM